MSILQELTQVLSKELNNNSKVVLCYRNTSNITIRGDIIYFKQSKLPWQKDWYFDKAGPFCSKHHFQQYNKATVIIVDEHAEAVWNNYKTDTADYDITASIWCAMEICLASDICIVSKNTTMRCKPSGIARYPTTHMVLRLLHDTIVRWQKSNKDTNKRNELQLNIKHLTIWTNNFSGADAQQICEAIYAYF